MTRLRFIKSWGPNKPGDIKLTDSKSTVHWLVDVYKFAVIETGKPAPVIEPTKPAPIKVTLEPERDLYKYVRNPQRDKMVTGAPKAKITKPNF